MTDGRQDNFYKLFGDIVKVHIGSPQFSTLFPQKTLISIDFNQDPGIVDYDRGLVLNKYILSFGRGLEPDPPQRGSMAFACVHELNDSG